MGGVQLAFPPAADATFLQRVTDCSSLGVTFSLSPPPAANLSFAMAGAIIENMSTKKLVIGGVILLLFQAFAFMVGGLIGKFDLIFLSLSRVSLICLRAQLNRELQTATAPSFAPPPHPASLMVAWLHGSNKRRWTLTCSCVFPH